MKSIYGITRGKLEEYFINKGDKKFRATQIFEWVYRKRAKSFDEMSNIKKETIKLLKQDFYFNDIKIITKEEDELVKKYLFELSDGNKIEAVLMEHDYGKSICVSSQIGCNMGCAFCESGRLKKVRNLTSDEMLLQVLKVEEDIKDRISHVVIMGIGEPFDNYDNVMDFINIINDAYALAIGIRHITVSTSGIVPKIKEFAKEGLGVNLAISLHAPNNEIRNKPDHFYESIGVDFEFPSFYEKFTALENLKFFGSLYDCKLIPVEQLLEMVGLSQHANKKVAGFSKGMKSRLNFARSIIHQPKVLFLDEPTSGLDPSNSQVMKNIILDLKNKGVTIILTTHNMHDATELCDRVAFIVDGNIKAMDTPHNLIMSRRYNEVTYSYLENQKELNTTIALDKISTDKKLQSLIQANALLSIHSNEPTLDNIFSEITGRKLL